MIQRCLLTFAFLIPLLGLPSAPSSSLPPPAISNLQILTPTMAAFDRFEARFDLKTNAAYPDVPYDPNPPAGLQAVSGVSVDAIFIAPSGRRITQPAFPYQPVDLTSPDSRDHIIPQGKPYWLVRFTPQEMGQWEFRLRAVDSGGMTLYPAYTPQIFTVSGLTQKPSRQHGFLRPGQKDPRYFEFQDGTPFIGTGFNIGFGSLAETEQQMQDLEQNRINFIRTWMSGDGINGSQWTPWASSFLPYDGYLPPVSFETRDTYPGHDLAWKLDSTNPCLFQGWQGGSIPVQPASTYTLWARVKVIGVGSPGFVLKIGGWLDKNCVQPDQGSAVTPALSGSSDWTEIRGTIQTNPGQFFLDYLYMARQGTAGVALVDEIRLYRQDDPDRVNILRQPSPNNHLSYDPVAAARWDALINLAENHGIYLKLVIDEKNEWIRNHIDSGGIFVDSGDNNNFYAAPGTKVRWLEQAWWRYITARWGYSTAIHSFEFVNEGDPYNSNHYEAAGALARYIHQRDPSHHMVTTSFWTSFPNREFWSNPLYADIDYADLHAYISTGWPGGNASFVDFFALDTAPANLHSSPASVRIDATKNGSDTITPRGLVLRETGEWLVRYWMKADKLTSNCPYNGAGSMVQVAWTVDGGPASGGSQGVVPTNTDGQDYVCTSPSGTFPWRAFRSDLDLQGQAIPQKFRLVIPNDGQPHEISLAIVNANGAGGTAWISDVELVSPSGNVVPVLGQFDPTSMQSDSAWYNAAYGLLLGAGSPVGAGKPLVRGEGAINQPDSDGYWTDLNQDKQGIWLHNNLWAQLGPGGIPDLTWWAAETIGENAKTGRVPGLYPLYLAYQVFMDGIPINNGQYRDTRAEVSDPRLRAWGQRDDANGKAHLWIQNLQHNWRAVVDGKPIQAVTGSVVLPEMRPGTYQVSWYDTYAKSNPIIKVDNLTTTTGNLTITLPAPLSTDIAVKIERTSP